jgi:hypothetical protein
MRIVRLKWRPRINRKKRAAMLKWIREHYKNAKDDGECVVLRAPNNDTKFVWIFMLSKTFSDTFSDLE